MAINADWHRKNRMPKNPTTEQRIAWHLEHAKACPCRPIPEKLAALIAQRGSGRSTLKAKPPRSR